MNEITLKITVDTSDLDEAIVKAKILNEELEKAKQPLSELDKEATEENIYLRISAKIIKMFSDESINLNEARHIIEIVREDLGEKSFVSVK